MSPEWTVKCLEAPPGIEPGMEVLQTIQGHFSTLNNSGRFSVFRGETRPLDTGETMRIMRRKRLDRDSDKDSDAGNSTRADLRALMERRATKQKAPRKTNRGWTHTGAARQHAAPTRLLAELERRRLDSLERCQTAWQEADDPLALAVAVTLAELPSWLRDALLVQVVDVDGKLWKRRTRDRGMVNRASLVASARVVGQPGVGLTWDMAYMLAESRLAAAGGPRVGRQALKKAYQAVLHGLANPGRYHLAPRGFAETIEESFNREIDRVKKRDKKTAR